MAKKRKEEQLNGSVDPAEGGVKAPPRTPATPSGTASEFASSAAPAPRAPSGPAARTEGGVLVDSVRAVRGVLPTSRVPVYLAGTALLVAGLVDPPVAIGAGLAYEALRRWEPQQDR